MSNPSEHSSVFSFETPLPVIVDVSFDSEYEEYESAIFTLSVGSEEHLFNVHQAALAQSPVLAAMCRHGFLEAQTKILKLPEDDPLVVRYAIKYLYRGNYGSLVLPIMTYSSLLPAALLADLYVFGDKYQLMSLKSSVLTDFDRHTEHIAVLRALRHVYENVTASTQQYRDYFAATAPAIIRMMTPAERQELEIMVAIGGSFAQDALKAQLKAFELEAKEMQEQHEKVRKMQGRDDSNYGGYSGLPMETKRRWQDCKEPRVTPFSFLSRNALRMVTPLGAILRPAVVKGSETKFF